MGGIGGTGGVLRKGTKILYFGSCFGFVTFTCAKYKFCLILSPKPCSLPFYTPSLPPIPIAAATTKNKVFHVIVERYAHC